MVDVSSLLVNPGLGPGGPGFDSAMINEEEQAEQEGDDEKNEEDPFWK